MPAVLQRVAGRNVLQLPTRAVHTPADDLGTGTVDSSRYVCVIGVDPGLACGIACYRSDGVRRRFDSLVLEPMACLDWIESRVSHWVEHGCVQSARLAVERYVITQQTIRKSRQHDALEVIGGCRWIAHRHRVPVALFGKSDAQRLGSDETLKRIGWRRDGDHRDRAAAQVLMGLQEWHHGELAAVLTGGRMDPGD